MAFYGLMILRDEADVLSQCLDELLKWIDGIFVLDLGSVDESWEIVQEYASRDRRVVPFMRKPMVFDDALRGMIFDKFRSRFRSGDWIMRVDGDEFYHVNPPVFCKERLGTFDTAVYLQWYFFRMTRPEVEAYEQGEVNILQDRKRPISERRRYYKIPDYAEPRLFKYRRSVRWPESVSFPFNAGFVAHERIPIRHYPHRDPLQMKQRYALRSAMKKLRPYAPGQWGTPDWRVDVLELDGNPAYARTNAVGLSAVSGHESGPLMYWVPGTELKEPPAYAHVPRGPRRLVQRIIHPAMLPILDRTRPQFSKSFQPEPIPEEFNKTIYESPPGSED